MFYKNRRWYTRYEEWNPASITFQNTLAWSDAIVSNGKIWGVPYYSTTILCIDPVAGTVINSTFGGALDGGAKWQGGVKDAAGDIWCIPQNSATIGKIYPQSGTVVRSTWGATLTGNNKYSRGALGNDGLIYCAPFSADNILVIDPVGGTAVNTNYGATFGADNAYGDFVVGSDGLLYGIPYNATTVLILDPVAKTLVNTTFGATLTGTQKWQFGVRANNGKIYGSPFVALQGLMILPNVNSPTLTTVVNSTFGAEWVASARLAPGLALGPNGKIYVPPFSSTRPGVLVIDPINDNHRLVVTAFKSGISPGSSMYWGIAFGSDGLGYAMPHRHAAPPNLNAILRIFPGA